MPDKFTGEMLSAFLRKVQGCPMCSRYYIRITIYLRDLYNGVSWNEHDTQVVEFFICDKHKPQLIKFKKMKENNDATK